MYYWFSQVANSYYVLDTHSIVKRMPSRAVIKRDYPDAEFIPCNEVSYND